MQQHNLLNPSSGGTKQHKLLNAILNDSRAKHIVPAQFTNTLNSADPTAVERLRYNRQGINSANPSKYRPIDHTAFH